MCLHIQNESMCACTSRCNISPKDPKDPQCGDDSEVMQVVGLLFVRWTTPKLIRIQVHPSDLLGSRLVRSSLLSHAKFLVEKRMQCEKDRSRFAVGSDPRVEVSQHMSSFVRAHTPDPMAVY